MMAGSVMGDLKGNDLKSIKRRRWHLAPFGRFARNRRGSVAIEFGALILPFSLLVFAILESSISFAAQQVMANATDDVARQFRTGQIKVVNEQQLKSLICERMQMVVTAGCPGLVVDLRAFNTFADAANQRIVITNGDLDTTGFKVEPGKSMSKNMLRVFYKWPVMTDFMRKSMASLNDGKTLHFASVTWQNEPFDD
jgi:Flp pilus assembly protein TadG